MISIANGIPPFTGRYAPRTPLGFFDGTDMQGTWTLRLTDSLRSGLGALESWSITFNPCEAEPEGEGEGDGEGDPGPRMHSADTNRDWMFSLSELLRVVQLYNNGDYQCAGDSEDGYAPGSGVYGCLPHSSDYAPQDWSIALNELLRMVQFYNSPYSSYHIDPTSEDGYAPGIG